LLSWGGSARFGGHDYLSFGWDLAVVALVGIAFFYWGIACGWRTPDMDEAESRHAPITD